MDTPKEPEAVGAGECRNCGSSVVAKFCGECGQELVQHQGSFGAITAEILSDWFALDGRVFRTIRALRKPGFLTTKYLDGKRVSFLAPFRLYLLVSVLLFSSILNLKAPDASGTSLTILGEQVISAPGRTEDGQRTSSSLDFLTADSWLGRLAGRYLADEVEELKAQPPQEVMDTMFDGLRRLLPTSLIVFVPFLALVLKLLYLRSGRYYVDHLVFAVHLQSALFLTLSIGWVVAQIANLSLLVSALIYAGSGFAFIALYVPMALRKVYEQGKFLTGVKSLVLLYCYFQLMGVVVSLPAIFALVQGA